MRQNVNLLNDDTFTELISEDPQPEITTFILKQNMTFHHITIAYPP